MADEVFNTAHWATSEPFVKSENIPEWIQGEDRARIGTYDLYDAIFWAAPESFQIKMRGQEGDPIYVPSGRVVVETAHRFMAPGMQIIVDPNFGDEAQQAEAAALMQDFTDREEVYSKFSAAKLHGLRRGDWAWHIFADPDKTAGSRVSLFELNPSNYFPIYRDVDDVSSVVGAIIAQPATADNGDTVITRTIYEITDEGKVQVHEDVCKVDEWGQPRTDMKETVIDVTSEPQLLPDPINQIPIYHIPNMYDSEVGWGSSEMAGIELLMRGLNQGVTDEELALVLEGIGVYVTDAGAPLDPDTGEELPWTLAVGHVLELPSGHDFKRVQGVNTIQPYQEHLKYLESWIDATTGGNDITRGRADVAVAESGIALALRMGPILARMSEKELIVTSRFTQMLFDLRAWFTAFEGLQGLDAIRWRPTYADKLPVNKQEQFNNIITMSTTTPVPIISNAEARRMLTQLGYTFSTEAELAAEVLSEQSEFQATTADAVASRVAGELNAGT